MYGMKKQKKKTKKKTKKNCKLLTSCLFSIHCNVKLKKKAQRLNRKKGTAIEQSNLKSHSGHQVGKKVQHKMSQHKEPEFF